MTNANETLTRIRSVVDGGLQQATAALSIESKAVVFANTIDIIDELLRETEAGTSHSAEDEGHQVFEFSLEDVLDIDPQALLENLFGGVSAKLPDLSGLRDILPDDEQAKDFLLSGVFDNLPTPDELASILDKHFPKK